MGPLMGVEGVTVGNIINLHKKLRVIHLFVKLGRLNACATE